MKRIAQLTAAAAVLVVLGVIFTWMTIGGGSTGIAFARVAEVLDNVRSVTFDATGEIKNPADGKTIHMTQKGWFLAPGYQRMESSMGDGDKKSAANIMIMDIQEGKALMMMPAQKIAITVDGEDWKKELEKRQGGVSPNMFEMVQRLVREGVAGPGDQVEMLGEKEINGRRAVGFRVRPTVVQDMTLWADLETAQPILIEIATSGMEGRVVMNNFHFDVDLDPSLFSLEPPAGYTTQSLDFKLPTEEDLLKILRLAAEHNEGNFPNAIGMNKEFMEILRKITEPEMEEITAKYGKESPEMMKAAIAMSQKYMGGWMFYMSLKPENDPHYVGGGVKLDTPDRPIFWYKPTGAEKYHVIYADLSVKEMPAEEVKQLSEAVAP